MNMLFISYRIVFVTYVDVGLRTTIYNNRVMLEDRSLILCTFSRLIEINARVYNTVRSQTWSELHFSVRRSN